MNCKTISLIIIFLSISCALAFAGGSKEASANSLNNQSNFEGFWGEIKKATIPNEGSYYSAKLKIDGDNFEFEGIYWRGGGAYIKGVFAFTDREITLVRWTRIK